jgi:hypothetical protein
MHPTNSPFKLIVDSPLLLTEKEGYEALLYTLWQYWEASGCTDLTDILSGGEYVEPNIPADPGFWYYWVDALCLVRTLGPPQFAAVPRRAAAAEQRITIEGTKTLTEQEGYEAMLYLLQRYWQGSGSDDLTDILQAGAYVEPDRPADPVFWYAWIEAIARVRQQGPPPLKVLH